MIINDLDLGDGHPYLSPQVGDLTGQYVVEGAAEIVYGRAGQIERMVNLPIRARAWQAIGGQTADTRDARRYFIRQLEELALNRELQPVFIQWEATAVSGAQLNTTNQHDGWYYIDEFKADFTKIVSVNQVPATISVSRVASAASRPQAMWYGGGALLTNYAGAAQIAIGFPLGTSNQPTSEVSRTGGEGASPLSVAPSASFIPLPFSPSATVANWFKGGCRVYDTINTSTNPVPTDGTFAHANWVEAKLPDHRFEGDCVVTNGLLLLLIQTSQSRVMRVYVWSTGQATPGWLLTGDILYTDTSGSTGALRGFSVQRVGLEEVRVITDLSSGAPQWAEVSVRLQRGMNFARVDFRSLSENMTSSSNGLQFSLASGNVKHIVWNESLLGDLTSSSIALTSLAPTANYGYGAIVPITNSFPFIVGLLYQNKPSTAQFTQNAYPTSGAALISLGENSLTQANVYSYAVFATPYGVNGSYGPVNLQGEAESGTLGTGWTSQANASASAGNEAKCASGTLSGNADLWATAFVPAPGGYDIWMRMKVTSAANTTAQMQAGLWNSDTSAFESSATTTFAPSQLTTSYAWYRTNKRTVTDGVTNGTTTVTSATAVFNSTADAGKAISGAGIPAGATISSVTNATTIVISSAATTSASGVTLTIGAPITPTATKNMRMRAVTAATLATDFFFDESALAPLTQSAANTGPQEIWQQFSHDRGTRLVRG